MNNKKSNGMSLFGLLAIVFIVLKLVGVIDWSWWYVLLPLWGPAAVGLAAAMMLLLVEITRILTRK